MPPREPDFTPAITYELGLPARSQHYKLERVSANGAAIYRSSANALHAPRSRASEIVASRESFPVAGKGNRRGVRSDRETIRGSRWFSMTLTISPVFGMPLRPAGVNSPARLQSLMRIRCSSSKYVGVPLASDIYLICIWTWLNGSLW